MYISTWHFCKGERSSSFVKTKLDVTEARDKDLPMRAFPALAAPELYVVKVSPGSVLTAVSSLCQELDEEDLFYTNASGL